MQEDVEWATSSIAKMENPIPNTNAKKRNWEWGSKASLVSNPVRMSGGLLGKSLPNCAASVLGVVSRV